MTLAFCYSSIRLLLVMHVLNDAALQGSVSGKGLAMTHLGLECRPHPTLMLSVVPSYSEMNVMMSP